jgi:hypothetical protein
MSTPGADGTIDVPASGATRPGRGRYAMRRRLSPDEWSLPGADA